MTTELAKSAPKIYSGDQIKGLFLRPESVEVITDSKKYGKIKFIIRPMNNDIYAEMGQAMQAGSMDIEKLSLLDGLKVFSNVYYPAMKVVFPACCIEPKITVGKSSNPSDLVLSEIPMEVCMDLFNGIMGASGLSEEDEEKRKN